MKKLYTLIRFYFASLIILFAASNSFSQDTDDVDFTSFKTYAFPAIQVNDSKLLEYEDRLLMVQQAIEAQLNSRGYEKAALGSSDLLVNIGVSVVEEAQTRDSDIRETGGVMAYTGQRTYYKEAGEVVVSYYNRGTVTLDVVDVSKSIMIWHGVTDGVVEADRTKEKAQKNVDRLIKNLFKKYPVKAAK